MKLRKLFSKKHTGPKQVKVGNYTLWANQEHPIQDYLSHFKYYSRNLPRIAKYMESKYPHFGIVDVGANIGDTIALLRTSKVDQLVYMVEGEPSYFDLLQKNLPQFVDAKAYKTFLGEESGTKTGGFSSAEGTSKLSNDAAQIITLQKLDELATAENFKDIKLLKIDTDGFDFSILRGSTQLIGHFKPVLFFEYDAVFLEEQHEHRTQTLEQLQGLGYNKIIYYDNFGKMLLSATLDQHLLLEQLYIYMRRKDGAFPYFDVCVFHKDDERLADEIIAKEMEFYNVQ